MDNTRLDMISFGPALLNDACALIMRSTGHENISHYMACFRAETPGFDSTPPMLLFFEYRGVEPTSAMQSLPFTLDLEGVVYFVQRWLTQVDYTSPPDIDGSLKKGWRISTSLDTLDNFPPLRRPDFVFVALPWWAEFHK